MKYKSKNNNLTKMSTFASSSKIQNFLKICKLRSPKIKERGKIFLFLFRLNKVNERKEKDIT